VTINCFGTEEEGRTGKGSTKGSTKQRLRAEVVAELAC
jgi:hypothetical protein